MANGYDGEIRCDGTDIFWIEPKIIIFIMRKKKTLVRRGLTNKKYLEMTRMQ
jgi:hypothetical protein